MKKAEDQREKKEQTKWVPLNSIPPPPKNRGGVWGEGGGGGGDGELLWGRTEEGL